MLIPNLRASFKHINAEKKKQMQFNSIQFNTTAARISFLTKARYKISSGGRIK
jgi:hypothetical protein